MDTRRPAHIFMWSGMAVSKARLSVLCVSSRFAVWRTSVLASWCTFSVGLFLALALVLLARTVPAPLGVCGRLVRWRHAWGLDLGGPHVDGPVALRETVRRWWAGAFVP